MFPGGEQQSALRIDKGGVDVFSCLIPRYLDQKLDKLQGNSTMVHRVQSLREA